MSGGAAKHAGYLLIIGVARRCISLCDVCVPSPLLSAHCSAAQLFLAAPYDVIAQYPGARQGAPPLIRLPGSE